MTEDEPRKRVSTKLCEPCFKAGMICHLSFEKWGNDNIKWFCECCNDSLTILNSDGHGHAQTK